MKGDIVKYFLVVGDTNGELNDRVENLMGESDKPPSPEAHGGTIR